MTDEQNAADRHRDQATDEDSPHAHQAPERRSWTDTTISTLLLGGPPFSPSSWPSSLSRSSCSAAPTSSSRPAPQ
jgi:hypothetical protein